jgi:excisionase family DNA binding protein
MQPIDFQQYAQQTKERTQPMQPIDFQQYAQQQGTGKQGEDLTQVKLYTMTEAAKLLGISKTVMYELTGKGKIPFIKFGGRLRRIRHSDLVAFIDQHTLGG